ncbi:hypothetical protein BDW59DRAFT_48719 [Aspergillus cavernicola]|uniref:Uncharacterized protein n=1 Tax=Aspergillus cavernicola TaxID=176166 RepID=A0ABR4J3Q3_9EURO
MLRSTLWEVGKRLGRESRLVPTNNELLPPSLGKEMMSNNHTIKASQFLRSLPSRRKLVPRIQICPTEEAHSRAIAMIGPLFLPCVLFPPSPGVKLGLIESLQCSHWSIQKNIITARKHNEINKPCTNQVKKKKNLIDRCSASQDARIDETRRTRTQLKSCMPTAFHFRPTAPLPAVRSRAMCCPGVPKVPEPCHQQTEPRSGR